MDNRLAMVRTREPAPKPSIIDSQLKDYFSMVRWTQTLWNSDSTVCDGQKTDLRNALRQITIQAAMAAEKGAH